MTSPEILKWVEPKIKLDEMSAINFKGVGENEANIDNLGNDPWITIRSFSLPSEKIVSLIIDSSEFYPFIYLTFNDSDNSFKSFDFPLNQDIISVYVKPKSTLHKALRCDFQILQVNGSDNISIKGIMKIPNSFDSKIFAQKSSSIEAVFKKTRDLNLGFASNFEISNDIQNWISFNQTYYSFIKSIENSCFINKESWVTSFVDLFYCTNWLNGELLYSLDSTLDKGVITVFNDVINQNLIQGNEKIDTFLLTNHPNFTSTDYGITIEPDFTESSNYQNGHVLNSISIDMSKGEVKTENVFVNEQQHESWKKISGRDENDILIEKTKWVGIQSSNMHENWNSAKAQNLVNNVNFPGIKIVSEGFTTEIMRGRRIPIFVINLNSNEMNFTEETIDNIPDSKLNDFWSGFYVVSSVRYEWNSLGWKTRASLKRKQWNSNSRKNHFGAFS